MRKLLQTENSLESIETPFTSVLDTLCQNNYTTTLLQENAARHAKEEAPNPLPLSLSLGAIRACRGGLQLLSLFFVFLLHQLAAKWQADDESPLGMTPERYSLRRLTGEGIMDDAGQALSPPPLPPPPPPPTPWPKKQTTPNVQYGNLRTPRIKHMRRNPPP